MTIGDVKSDARGSGARYNDGKPDFSLLPLCTLEDEIRVWMYGKKKYAAWNWAKGMDWEHPFACCLRHLSAWQRGEENDPESGLPHLAHAQCNLRMLTLYSKTYPEGDHRPKEWLGPFAALADHVTKVLSETVETLAPGTYKLVEGVAYRVGDQHPASAVEQFTPIHMGKDGMHSLATSHEEYAHLITNGWMPVVPDWLIGARK